MESAFEQSPEYLAARCQVRGYYVEQLDPKAFWLVHRGTIVNAKYVTAARHDESGRVVLNVRDRPEQLTVSRAYAHLFRQM